MISLTNEARDVVSVFQGVEGLEGEGVRGALCHPQRILTISMLWFTV